MRLVVRLCAAALALLLPAGVVAQTTGALRGRVTDLAGRPMAGVTIVVASSAAAVTGRGAVSDDHGGFHVPSLPAGRDYVVQATFPAHAVLVLSRVEVRAGETTTLRLTLQPQTDYLERVEVRARPQVVRLEEVSSDTRLSSEFIDALPILGRNYQDLLTLAPGVTDIDGDGNPNIHGARDTDVGTYVDGVSTVDPLTGKFGAQLNIEAIQEIEIKTSGASAEYSRAQGGFVNIVTKSGGNEFQGSFKFFWRGSALDRDGAGIDDPRLHGGVGERGLRDLEFNDFMPFLSLEGPIARDRAWFFMAHEFVQREEPVNALSAAFVAGVREFREFAKLTWQVTPNSRLALSLNYDPQRYFNQGLTSFTREESGFTSRLGGPILTLKATSVLGPYVVLETSVSHFDERPSRQHTLDPDTNGNGVLYLDRNGNGFIEASERDPGEDYDADGAFDVFEDFLRPFGAFTLDEDRDGDGRQTPPFGCEGEMREDTDCDGRLDRFPEDFNGNGRLDPGEDIDGDGRLDPGTEDRNDNSLLDDTPFPLGDYPYGRLRPIPQDRDYSIDQNLRIVSGPFFQEYADRRRRLTLREDLGVYVPDYWGSHDLKMGFVVEREDFARDTLMRSVLAPLLRSRRSGPSTVHALVPADPQVRNGATNMATGVYAQDHYRPFPNLSLGFGLRFDRELTESFGYSQFEPAAERALFDHIMGLAGVERGYEDQQQGNGDGIRSMGIQSDPMFGHPVLGPETTTAALANDLRIAAFGRLTRHHIETRFASQDLAKLFPEILRDGEIDPQALALLGIVPQGREKFSLSNNNLAPRLSVSWDPWSTGRTKVFATWGRYYDKLFLSTVIGEEGPDVVNRYYQIDEDGVSGNGTPNSGIGRILSKAPPSTTQVTRGLETPFSDEFTAGFEREIAPEFSIGVTFISRRYRRQLQDIDVNHELRFGADGRPIDTLGAVRLSESEGGGGVAGARLPDGRRDLFIHNYFFNQVLRVGNFNQARYRAVQMEFLKRLSRRWELLASYTHSRAVGDAEDFQSRLGNDPSTLESEPGYLDFDQRHVVKLNAMTFLPGDWQVGLGVTWSSGLPYSIVSRFFAFDNVDYLQYRTAYGFTERLNPSLEHPQGGWRFVPVRRNALRNRPFYDINVRAKKALVVGRASAAVFLEVYNLLNTDDLRIFTYEPHLQPADFSVERPVPLGPLQLDAVRRFGRRFQVGFQIDF
jgi:hypothetical protein